MSNAAATAYERLTRASLVRAYVPAAAVGSPEAIAELVARGLAAAVGANVIRVRASHAL